MVPGLEVLGHGVGGGDEGRGTGPRPSGASIRSSPDALRLGLGLLRRKVAPTGWRHQRIEPWRGGRPLARLAEVGCSTLTTSAPGRARMPHRRVLQQRLRLLGGQHARRQSEASPGGRMVRRRPRWRELCLHRCHRPWPARPAPAAARLAFAGRRRRQHAPARLRGSLSAAAYMPLSPARSGRGETAFGKGRWPGAADRRLLRQERHHARGRAGPPGPAPGRDAPAAGRSPPRWCSPPPPPLPRQDQRHPHPRRRPAPRPHCGGLRRGGLVPLGRRRPALLDDRTPTLVVAGDLRSGAPTSRHGRVAATPAPRC